MKQLHLGPKCNIQLSFAIPYHQSLFPKVSHLESFSTQSFCNFILVKIAISIYL